MHAHADMPRNPYLTVKTVILVGLLWICHDGGGGGRQLPASVNPVWSVGVYRYGHSHTEPMSERESA